MFGLDSDLFVAFPQRSGQEIAVGGLEGTAGERHLSLMMRERLGALGEHQVVIGGVLEQGQQHSSLPAGDIGGENGRGALAKNRPQAVVRELPGAHSRSSSVSASSSQSASSSASKSLRSSSSMPSVYSPRAMAAAIPNSSIASCATSDTSGSASRAQRCSVCKARSSPILPRAQMASNRTSRSISKHIFCNSGTA